MAAALTYFRDRQRDHWLLDCNPQEFAALVEQSVAELSTGQTAHRDRPPIVFLAEHDPHWFWARFLAACIVPCHAFLLNPNWRVMEWQQLLTLVQPDRVWGLPPATLAPPKLPSPANLSSSLPDSLIMIPTGGSSGTLRFAMHTWETLMASVTGFQQYFQVEAIHSFCVLPPYHVSGLMQFLRSLTTGGTLHTRLFKPLTQSPLPALPPQKFFLSLVPTQLHTLLQQADSRSWLTQFHTVMLGGAPLSDRLRQTAIQAGIPLAPTYGMTETAAQVVTLKPSDSLSGRSGCGHVLPHAAVVLQQPQPDPQTGHAIGAIAIHTNSLALGYYPTPFTDAWFQTDDLGFWDDHGSLHLVGRNSDKIITGGENVFPAEVEAAIQATGGVQDVSVIGVSDRHWGQAVTAIYVPRAAASPESLAALQAQLRRLLSPFKLPKHWIAVAQLPRNAQGKINRQQLMTLALEQLAIAGASAAQTPVNLSVDAEPPECTHDESQPD